jgi:hypothetical protein
MSLAEQSNTSLSKEMGRNFVLWLLGVPIVIALVNIVTETPMPDAEGLKQLAIFAVPTLLAASALDALANRWTQRAARAYGKGFAFALVIFLIGSADRPMDWWTTARVMKTIILIPVAASIMAVGYWGKGSFIGENRRNV